MSRQPAARKLRGKRVPRWLAPLRKAGHWLTARLVIGIFSVLRLLPADVALNFADRVARLIGPRLGRHRVAMENLRLAYPDRAEAELQQIASDMWGNMARLATEYVFLDGLFDFDPNSAASGRVEVVGIDRFIRIAGEDRPHIIFTAHVGNFELLPIAAAVYGLKVTALFRPPNNPYIARHIYKTRSGAMGDLLASQAGAAFALSGILERGGNVGMLVDQRFINGVPSTFFERPCETNPILAMLARRFDCDVYPARCTRLPGNRFRLELQEKLELPRDEQGNVSIASLTQQLNDVVEGWVRETPGQWMWFHKRWAIKKTDRRRQRRWLDRENGSAVS